MEDKINSLYELCETLDNELCEANEKIRQAGGKLSTGDLDVIDKLTHAMKSVKTTIAMMESEDEGGYSGRSMMSRYAYADGNMGGSYDGGSYDGGSYRGMSRGGMYRSSYNDYSSRRGRDSMGRYTSRGYSRSEDMAQQLKAMADQAPDEKTKQDLHRMAVQMEQQK